MANVTESHNNDKENYVVDGGIEEDCRKLEKTLKDLHSQIESVCSNNSAQSPESCNSKKKMLLMLECQLKAEIETLTLNDPPVLPNDATMLQEILHEELTQNLKQMQDVISLLRDQRNEMQMQVERMEKQKQQQLELKKALEEKILKVSATAANVSTSSVVQRLEVKIRRAENIYKCWTKQMRLFLRTHFPPVTEDQVQVWNKKFQNGKDLTANILLSMEKILENLMNRSIQSPNDPYINVDNTYWPPYVELLLRVGVAVRHPTIAGQIKLTPFHM